MDRLVRVERLRGPRRLRGHQDEEMSDARHPRTDQRGPVFAHTGQQERPGLDAVPDILVAEQRSRRVFHGLAADGHVYRGRQRNNRTDAHQ